MRIDLSMVMGIGEILLDIGKGPCRDRPQASDFVISILFGINGRMIQILSRMPIGCEGNAEFIWDIRASQGLIFGNTNT